MQPSDVPGVRALLLPYLNKFDLHVDFDEVCCFNLLYVKLLPNMPLTTARSSSLAAATTGSNLHLCC